MAADPGRLQKFYEFLQLFTHREIEPGLISAVQLFDLAQGEGAAPGGEQLTRMIEFASRHATAEGRVRLLEVLGRAADLTGGLPRAEDYDPLIRFLTDGARTSGRPEHRALAFRAWTSLTRHHLLVGGRGLATAEGTWEHLQRELGLHGSELAGLVLVEPIWSDPSLPQLPAAALAFLLRATWRCLDLAGRLPAWEQEEVHTLLAALGSHETAASAQAALAAAPPDPEPLVSVSRRLRDAHVHAGKETRSTALAVGRALSRVLAGTEAATAAAVRRHLEAAEEWDLLLGEWLSLLETASDPLSAFASYQRNVLTMLPRYEETCLPAVVSSLLHQLSEVQRSTIALEWLRRGEIDRYPQELAEKCIALANLAVPLDPTDKEGQEAAKWVADAARSRQLRLRPDRSLLQEVLVATRAPKGSLSDLRLAEIRDSVAALPEVDHAMFVEGFLAGALERATNKAEHQQVLAATAGGRPALVEKSYLGFFKAKRKIAWPVSLQAALRFWLAFDGRDTGILAKLEETAQRGLLLVLEHLEPERSRQDRQQAPYGPHRWPCRDPLA